MILSQLWDQVKDRSPRRYTVDLYHTLQGEGLLLRDFLKKQLEALRTSHPTEVEKGFDLEVLRGAHHRLGHGEPPFPPLAGRTVPRQAGRLPGLLQRFKDLYLLVDPPADPNAVKDPRVEDGPGDEPGPRRPGAAGAGGATTSLQSRPRRRGKILGTLGTRNDTDRESASLNEAQLALSSTPASHGSRGRRHTSSG